MPSFFANAPGEVDNISTIQLTVQNNEIIHQFRINGSYYTEYNGSSSPGDFMYPGYFGNFEDIEKLKTVLIRTLLPILCVGGIVGIILTVLVLSRKNMCTSTNCYLKALAITDLIFLTLLMTRLLDNRIVQISEVAAHRFFIYLTYLEIVLQFFNLVSIWLTVMLSIERYMAICHPLRAVSLSTVWGARWIIAFIYFIAFLCSLPKFWEIEVDSYTESTTNASLWYITPTDLQMNTQYILAYRILYECILSAVKPFIFLITINCRLTQEIHKSTRYLGHQLAADSIVRHVISAEQLQLTLMLIGITLVFFLCQAPYVIYTIIGVINKYRNVSNDMGFHIFWCISLLLLPVKSVINFILYCWFSEKFRVTFKRLFCMPNCLTRPATTATNTCGKTQITSPKKLRVEYSPSNREMD